MHREITNDLIDKIFYWMNTKFFFHINMDQILFHRHQLHFHIQPTKQRIQNGSFMTQIRHQGAYHRLIKIGKTLCSTRRTEIFNCITTFHLDQQWLLSIKWPAHIRSIQGKSIWKFFIISTRKNIPATKHILTQIIFIILASTFGTSFIVVATTNHQDAAKTEENRRNWVSFFLDEFSIVINTIVVLSFFFLFRNFINQRESVISFLFLFQLLIYSKFKKKNLILIGWVCAESTPNSLGMVVSILSFG